MNINRNNYETFFICYIDNELTVAEKKLVDEFIAQNPDLMEELVMFQQSLLIPDEIIFDNKALLLKTADLPASMQHNLLLHLDGELSSDAAAAINENIAANGEVRAAWNILQQTKLEADKEIIFADKPSLYRYENGKVIVFPWKKLAVAAVFIGFILWGGVAFLNTRKALQNSSDAVVKSATTNKLTDTKKTNQPALPVPKESTIDEDVTVANTSNDVNPPAQPEYKTASVKKDNIASQNIATKNITNDLPEPVLENINKSGRNNTITAYVPPVKLINNMDDPGQHVTEGNDKKNTPLNSFASTASFTESSEENENRVFFMDEDKVKKSKLGTFFKKAKRVLERNTKINGGNSNNLKVANLEFAIQ